MLTKGGVCYDFNISPFKVEVCYDEIQSLTFVFSSRLYTSLFKRRLEANREKINKSLSNRFKMQIDFKLLADIKLYSEVEKRGFLIIGRDRYTCLNTIQLSGIKKIYNN